jgi:hypothetical protein
MDSTRASTVGNGVAISAHIGIDLSSRAGFTTRTAHFFAFNHGDGHRRICGTRANPVQEDDAGWIVIRGR